jgi:hypothetical protein
VELSECARAREFRVAWQFSLARIYRSLPSLALDSTQYQARPPPTGILLYTLSFFLPSLCDVAKFEAGSHRSAHAVCVCWRQSAGPHSKHRALRQCQCCHRHPTHFGIGQPPSLSCLYSLPPRFRQVFLAKSAPDIQSAAPHGGHLHSPLFSVSIWRVLVVQFPTLFARCWESRYQFCCLQSRVSGWSHRGCCPVSPFSINHQLIPECRVLPHI